MGVRRASVPEPLDDNHATAAAWTRVRQQLGFVDLGITVIPDLGLYRGDVQ
jgi:hypothetical protein